MYLNFIRNIFVTLMFWLHRNNMADKIGTFHICWISCWYIHYLLLKLYTIKSPYTFNIHLSPLRKNITFFFTFFKLKSIANLIIWLNEQDIDLSWLVWSVTTQEFEGIKSTGDGTNHRTKWLKSLCGWF
jgi:hypothetical protein